MVCLNVNSELTNICDGNEFYFVILYMRVCMCMCVCVNVCTHVSVLMMFICLTCRKSWHILELKSLRIFYLCWVFQSKGRSRYSAFLWSFFFLPLFCNCLCKDLQVFYSMKILFYLLLVGSIIMHGLFFFLHF